MKGIIFSLVTSTKRTLIYFENSERALGTFILYYINIIKFKKYNSLIPTEKLTVDTFLYYFCNKLYI